MEAERKKKIRRHHLQTTGLPRGKERKARKKGLDKFQKLSSTSPRCINATDRHIN